MICCGLIFTLPPPPHNILLQTVLSPSTPPHCLLLVLFFAPQYSSSDLQTFQLSNGSWELGYFPMRCAGEGWERVRPSEGCHLSPSLLVSGREGGIHSIALQSASPSVANQQELSSQSKFICQRSTPSQPRPIHCQILLKPCLLAVLFLCCSLLIARNTCLLCLG